MTSPSTYDFELDDFQLRALAALDEGQSVLVAAPTGSGKTVVAEHAVASALANGRKAFYTTPIKALSNQKYHDLVRAHGSDRVGLLTGDNSINGEAPVVVMTTEVLRNMVYAGSSTLDRLEFVVLDEVHYLQDAYRGPVWEEIIIHLPRHVRLVCLSATVSNAEELANWISTVRGPTAAIIEERRPIALHNLYLAGDRGSERLHLLPTLVDGRPNPEASRLDASAVRGPRRRHQRAGQNGGGRRLFTPRRVEVVERLEEERMLPAIYFIFSRAACDDAVRACLDAGVRLTSAEERERIRAICEERTNGLSDDDLDVLGWGAWISGMEAGVASHHAGLVPPFKEAVEACFTAGLVKVVFATETLSVGINMPARAVVLEKLSKFTGERHQLLTAGEYTQLTGRAGRRGIDDVGYAIVLWSPFVTFEQVANLVSTRTFAISSQFRPTYNMAANLVRRYEPGEAHHLLNLSFAQYQADQDIVRLESRLDRVNERIEAARGHLACDRGDAEGYLDLQRRLSEARAARPSISRRIDEAMSRLRPGDVVRTNAGPAAILSATPRRGSMQLKVLTAKRNRHTLGPADFDAVPRRLGTIDLPEPYLPNNASFQRQVAAELREARLDEEADEQVAVDPELDRLTAAIDAHPVAVCPDLPAHRRAAAQLDRLEREKATLERQVRGRSATIARHFDRVLELLETWGYLDGWSLTRKGEQLSRIYHEADLLLAEALDRGVLDGLDAPSLAGLVSTFVYETRGPGEGPAPWFPSRDVRRCWADLEALWAELGDAEEAAGLPTTRELDPGFVALAYAWAAGEDLPDVLEDEELSGGDFVRVIKQLVDLLRQVAEVADVPTTRATAARAAEGLYRGVVSASSVVAGDDPQG